MRCGTVVAGEGVCYLWLASRHQLELGRPYHLRCHAGAPWQCVGDEEPLAAGHEVPAHAGGWPPAGQCSGKFVCRHNMKHDLPDALHPQASGLSRGQLHSAAVPWMQLEHWDLAAGGAAAAVFL